MRRFVVTATLAASLLLATAGSVAAETVSVGGATASSVGAWVKPTACSQLPVEYAGIPADSTATINVLDAVTRTSLGSELLLPTDPGSGRANIQICSFQVKDTSQILLSLDVSGVGVADSATFVWSPRPNTVRCVNKRTYKIREFTGKKCPSGWVKR
jgi:hypothetical protein